MAPHPLECRDGIGDRRLAGNDRRQCLLRAEGVHSLPLPHGLDDDLPRW